HERTESVATVLTAHMDDPFGYGRVVRDVNGMVERIVEQKDATDEEKKVTEINTATYCFDNEDLFAGLQHITNDNNQGEYYLTDLIEIFNEANKKVSAFVVDDAEETAGINDRIALAAATKVMIERINNNHLLNGVTIIDPEQTYIGPDVTIASDVTIYPGTEIYGNSSVGEGTVLGANTTIHNCQVGEKSVIRQSVLENSKIGNEADIGPFAHIRPETIIGEHVKVGNFVE